MGANLRISAGKRHNRPPHMERTPIKAYPLQGRVLHGAQPILQHDGTAGKSLPPRSADWPEAGFAYLMIAAPMRATMRPSRITSIVSPRWRLKGGALLHPRPQRSASPPIKSCAPCLLIKDCSQPESAATQEQWPPERAPVAVVIYFQNMGSSSGSEPISGTPSGSRCSRRWWPRVSSTHWHTTAAETA